MENTPNNWRPRRGKRIQPKGEHSQSLHRGCARDVEIITRTRPPRFNLPLQLAGNGNREEDRRLQKIEREVTHAKSSSDRPGAASEKRRQGDSRRGRHGRHIEGSDLSGRVRQTRPLKSDAMTPDSVFWIASMTK